MCRWIQWLTPITQRKSWGRKTFSFSLKRPTFGWVVNKHRDLYTVRCRSSEEWRILNAVLLQSLKYHRKKQRWTRPARLHTHTKSPSFFIRGFGASLTKHTPILPRSRNSSCYLSRPIYWHLQRSDYSNTLIYAHTTWRTLPTCDIRLGSLTLSTYETRDLVELVLLY